MKNKKAIQSICGSIKNHMCCESVGFEIVSNYIGYSGGIYFYEHKHKFVCWYGPSGAPDSEWSEFHMPSGKVSLTADQLKEAK